MTNKQDELKACEEVITMEDRAYEYGRSINWPQSHAKYAAKYAAVDYLEGARQERALMDSDLRKREEEAFNAARDQSVSARGDWGRTYKDFADYEEEKRRGKE